MKTVREILLNKGNQVWTISPDSTVYDALKLMSEKEIGAVLVCEGDNIKGIMSERDYARKIILQGKLSKETKISEIMSDKVIYVNPEMRTNECMALMINKKIRHLPVLEDQKLAGLISIGDVVNAVIDEKEFLIDQLVNYITSTPSIK
ncbi:MAG TPA: CBS domain-containing protein [Ignavibacteriaceae bacterium]|nr:CBS domain-containing protein [Ignavibacteriaceae bacterium]